jgi:hypothetical protein
MPTTAADEEEFLRRDDKKKVIGCICLGMLLSAFLLVIKKWKLGEF